jgi:hypothetical protein
MFDNMVDRFEHRPAVMLNLPPGEKRLRVHTAEHVIGLFQGRPQPRQQLFPGQVRPLIELLLPTTRAGTCGMSVENAQQAARDLGFCAL